VEVWNVQNEWNIVLIAPMYKKGARQNTEN